MLLYAPGKSV